MTTELVNIEHHDHGRNNEEFTHKSNLKEVKMEPLSEEEIRVARIYVKNLSPLYHEPIEKILPWLCCCLRVRKHFQSDNDEEFFKDDKLHHNLIDDD
jgi:hypothetical protein